MKNWGSSKPQNRAPWQPLAQRLKNDSVSTRGRIEFVYAQLVRGACGLVIREDEIGVRLQGRTFRT